MDVITAFIIGLILIGIESVFIYKSSILNVFVWVVKAPILLFEYLILFCYWGGDGVVTLISIPLCYTLFIWLQFIMLKKYQKSHRVKKVLINSMIFITPLLCIVIAYLIAMIFGFEIEIA